MSAVEGTSSEVLVWLPKEALASVPTAEFWNDEEQEKDKAFYLVDGDPNKLWKYLREETTYLEEYYAVLQFVDALGRRLQGTGVDLASGVCWTSALLSQLETVERLFAVDISQHRLLKLAPAVFKLMRANEAKICRALGSFYDIQLQDASVDFCMMSQAFHHADAPRRLLVEVLRVLKPGGLVLMIGEAPVYPSLLWKRRLLNIVKMGVPSSWYTTKPIYRVLPSFEALFPVDHEMGDHYYTIHGYQRMFGEQGLRLNDRRTRRYTVFVAVKEDRG
jgi:SAM-dependent methyltransferase